MNKKEIQKLEKLLNNLEDLTIELYRILKKAKQDLPEETEELEGM